MSARDDETGTEAPAAGAPAPCSELVVAVGASAGALPALRTLFGAMPPDTGAAFVVVVHRSPQSERGLAELLQPYTALRVREPSADVLLEPNTIDIVPPTADVAGVDTHLRLAPARGGSPLGRIDRLLRAAAEAHGARSVGIVLTGAGSDGALGLAQIKRRGGLTIAQSPREAEHGGMPLSAIEAGRVDLVLPVREMPAVIARFARADPHLKQELRDAAEEAAPLRELRDLLAARTGHDFSVYRRSSLLRRVDKRMRVHAIDDCDAYIELVRTDAREAAALAEDLLLHVSEFFDGTVLAGIESEALPRLFALKTTERDTLRAWVVGCSTGEDAYSLAITLLEERARRDSGTRLQVFASDVDEESLQHARAGVYPLEIEQSMSPERLEKFFVREGGRAYRVRSALRNAVVFASHDVVRDFPFSQLDLVVCRSGFLEDLKPEVRRAVLRNFHYALHAHGLLVVDASAALTADVRHLFVPDGDGGLHVRAVSAPRSIALPPAAFSAPSAATPAKRPLDPRQLHLSMLERYAPASVLIDADDRVVDYSARAGRFLRLPGGELTHELEALLREPLRSAVRGGIDAVNRRAAKWTSDPLIVHADSGVSRVAVHVERAASDEADEVNAKVVVFEEVGAGDDLRGGPGRRVGDFTSLIEAGLDEASRRLRAVVTDGDGERQHTQGGTAQDWEIVRALDDLDSAREELQSVNHELLTLDSDNRSRLEELARLSADLEVLLESTGLATLFLDRELKVVRFTPALLDLFDVRPGDAGRPLAELEHRLQGGELVDDARRVLNHAAPVERELPADNGRWYLLRMFPYRSESHGLGGVAITLVDITSRKQAELKLREADRRKDEFIALLAHELRNPLAPITSGIEILKRRGVDRAVAERVTQTMSRQAAQLVRLIDDLLDVSRISSGRLQLRKSPAALDDIVRDAVAAVRPMIDRSNHELSVDAPHERIALDADAARLTQVLANLLNNAARYTPNGGKIEVRVRRDGGAAVVAVKDNGYGIPEKALPHVFEMFYQAADPRSAQSGLGIGLALAKSLVEMHGGSIAATSEGVDRGSEFTLRLPVSERADAVAGTGGAVASAQALGGHRVLVVDDNADAAKTLAVLIQTLGKNDVHVAFSGAEALPLAERLKPDTVFLDLKMPDMDGYEVAHRLRQEPWGERTCIVALTGWGLEEHKRRTKDAGFDEHLTKPADRAALEAILSRPVAPAVEHRP
jgi:two-component system CheB/CheR fusion protein